MDSIKNSFKKIEMLSKKDGVFVEMLLTGSEELKLVFQNRKLEKFNSSHCQTAGLRVVKGAAQGYAWTENLSEEALQRTYFEALSNAQLNHGLSEEASDAAILDAMPIPYKIEATEAMLDLYDEEEISIERKMEIARELESAALDLDSRIQNVPYGGFTEVKSWRRILNSIGLDKEFKQLYYSGATYPLAKQNDVSKMDGQGFVVRKFLQIKAKENAETAARKTLGHLGAQKLKTGNYPVIFDREIAKDMIGQLGHYFSAKNIFENKSLLKGRLGHVMAAENFTLFDDPLDRVATGVRPFDAEGSASRKTPLIEGGVLKNFLTNLEFAKKMNLPNTASAARSPSSEMNISSSNLIVQKGRSSLDEMLNIFPRVVHLTNINGGMHSGFNTTTGDFSLPGEAYLYENGKNLGPVDQFVFSGNLFEMLKNIQAVGNEHCEPSDVMAPDLLIKELSFAGA